MADDGTISCVASGCLRRKGSSVSSVRLSGIGLRGKRRADLPNDWQEAPASISGTGVEGKGGPVFRHILGIPGSPDWAQFAGSRRPGALASNVHVLERVQ